MGVLDFKHHITNPTTLIFSKSRDQQTFPVKGHILNMLSSLGHMVSVSTTQQYCCSTKANLRQYINE